jgi:hypothetical protein
MPRLTADPWFDSDDLEPFAPDRHAEEFDTLDVLAPDPLVAHTVSDHARAA